MSDIPQELMETGWAILRQIHRPEIGGHEAAQIIARALYAERKRAANIARTATQEVYVGDGEFVTRPAYRNQIAIAILTYKEPVDAA